jgi:endonuclease-8
VPEGDSLHRAARRLQVLVGDRLSAESPNPRGEATGVARRVDGRVLESVEAVGKHLLLRFEGGVVLRSHLRMNGRWRVCRLGAPYTGRPWLVLRGREWQAVQWNGPVLAIGAERVRTLGPDLLADATDVDEVVRRVGASEPDRLVGEALLDQRLVAGIGNMWLAEGLWHGRVSPWHPVGDVPHDELRTVLDWTRRAMRASVEGQRPVRAVYRRAGRPCPRCGSAILSRGLGDANRTAYWCPSCQPLSRGSA